MSQANELLCCLSDLDTGIHSFRLQLCVCGSERRDPSAFRPLTSKESEFQMCNTIKHVLKISALVTVPPLPKKSNNDNLKKPYGWIIGF